MIWLSGFAYLALAASQPPAASPGATQQPRQAFVICPGHPRCPRNTDPNDIPVTGSRQPNARGFSFGRVDLRSGFTPDPRIVRLRAGGATDAASLQRGCEGFVSARPALRISYTAGSLPLLVTAVGPTVSVLINGPDGRYFCTPLSAEQASYRFAQPASGSYEIWVGAPRGTTARVELRLSEIDAPAGFAPD